MSIVDLAIAVIAVGIFLVLCFWKRISSALFSEEVAAGTTSDNPAAKDIPMRRVSSKLVVFSGILCLINALLCGKILLEGVASFRSAQDARRFSMPTALERSAYMEETAEEAMHSYGHAAQKHSFVCILIALILAFLALACLGVSIKRSATWAYSAGIASGMAAASGLVLALDAPRFGLVVGLVYGGISAIFLYHAGKASRTDATVL